MIPVRDGAHVLVAGVSARAAAASAARAGFRVTALDAFADLDQAPGVRAIGLPRHLGRAFTPHAAARASRSHACDAVCYLSPFENHPGAVTLLSRGRALWGNPPDVLRRVRDPVLVADAVRMSGLAAPAVFVTAPADPARREWLLKPRASGGGHRIRAWRRGQPVPRDFYVQERIEGAAASIVFVAVPGAILPLALSLQLVGDAAFGAGGYRYCGSILPGAGDAAWSLHSGPGACAVAVARAVSAAFGLTGVNGIDLVVRNGEPVPVEVNPRWCASIELVERAYGMCVFAAHASACTSGALLAVPPAPAPRAASGKAVVFARHDALVGNTGPWGEDGSVGDVPVPGTSVTAGQPVCTVFATGRDVEACHAALAERAARIHAGLSAWAR